ncbi:MAG: ATP-dependent DNA helicase, partial [Bacteroidota bacterium]
QDRMERLKAAARLFPRYTQQMRRQGRYDYEDMILWVLNAFEKNISLLRRYQEQYLYFLVDEYQDTNGAQNKVLQKLMDFWQSPNVFIVGDDDQSIYEFQGARLKNLSDFYERYEEDLELVLLQENYRSSQPLLDSSFQLIEQNEKRLINYLKDLGLEKRLNANQLAKKAISPKIVEYPNRLQEAVDIVQQIEVLQQEGFPLQEVAIIYAQHKQIRNIITLLDKKNIPYQVKRKVNILEEPLIANIRLLLSYLQAEYKRPYSGEHLLYPLLYADFLQIEAQDIASISAVLAKTDRKQRPTWRDFLQQLSSETSALSKSLVSLPKIQQLNDFLQLALNDYRNFPLPILMERLVNRSGILQHIIQEEDKAWKLQVLKTFFDFAHQEASRNPKISIQQLLQILDNMETNRLRLEINKATVAEAGVQLVTAHSSKGLEFDRVFLLDAVQDAWDGQKRRRSFSFLLPDTLTYSGEEDALEARRRLFYVGMTRTKTVLQISYSLENEKNKALQRTLFIDELLANTNLSVESKQVPFEQVLAAQAVFLQSIERPQLPTLPKDYVNALLENFRLSISSLNTYLRCPLSFLYEYVLQAPTLMSEAATYGEAMHRAWQRFFEHMLSRKNKAFPSEKRLIDYFEEELKNLRHQLSDGEFRRRLEMGRKSLSYYFHNHLSTWEKEVRLEFNIK